ncbi:hypothetical protein ECANGB1_2327 [Enterospora canceri]|uniref:Uncharacterized protein n=1 Tax=Enterospora canceri TaxID=1081671 RepID=A0A1Y1S9A9_9MICR|nr:hypothetical protein ECANGB1_2327 [Enterospora canceri]
MIKERIKYLQTIKTKFSNMTWTKEVVKTHLFYNEIEKCKAFLRYSEFGNKEADFLVHYVKAYEKLKNKQGDQRMLLENDALKHLDFFISLYEAFDVTIDYNAFKNCELTVANAYILYHRSELSYFLDLIVENDPYASKELFIEYSKQNGIKECIVMNVLEHRCCDWAFYIALRNNWL